MCLALIAIDQHPLYKVIILSNRDEFYARDSAPANFWCNYPNIFAGKDLIKHGAWLGVNNHGHFALITNYRDPKSYKPSSKSRGLLVSNYLSNYTNRSPIEYLDTLKNTRSSYNKFNIIIGRINNAYYYSNVKNEAKQLLPGIYCISNHLLDTPWYKVGRAKELFISLIDKLIKHNNPDEINDLLFNILSDNVLSPDYLLPKTGISTELEKSLSSIYVNIPGYKYGTCSSSIILFEKNNISFAEKIFNNGNFLTLKRTDITPLYSQ